MNKSNGIGVASLVCGILSLCTSWYGYFIATALGILAILFSSKSKQTVGNNGLALGGLVFGGIGLICSIPVTICSLACGEALCSLV